MNGPAEPPNGASEPENKQEIITESKTEITSEIKTEIREERPKKNKKKNRKIFWIIRIFFVSFTISALLSVVSETVTSELNIWVAIIILFLFIATGVIFDIIGVAVTTSNPSTFNSMAAKKVKGAKTALWCTANAAAVSNFCNDVIGDIAGIVSGSMGAVISMSLAEMLSVPLFPVTVIVTGLISGFTIGGKALGKGIAMSANDNIVFLISRILSIFKKEK